MLTVNVDIKDQLINGLMGIVKHFENTEHVVSTIFIEFDDIDAGRNLILTNRFAIQNNWLPIKKCDTSIFIGNSSGSLSIKRTQFLIRLSWACTMHKVQGLTIPQAVVSFELEKRKTFKPGPMYVALGRIKSLKGLFLASSFQQDAIKANVEATNEYERLNNEALCSTNNIKNITKNCDIYLTKYYVFVNYVCGINL